MTNKEKLTLYQYAYKRANTEADAARAARAAVVANKAKESAGAHVGTPWGERYKHTAKMMGDRLKPAFANKNLLWSLPVGLGVGSLAWLFGARPGKATALGLGAAGLTALGTAGGNSLSAGKNSDEWTTADILKWHFLREKQIKEHRESAAKAHATAAPVIPAQPLLNPPLAKVDELEAQGDPRERANDLNGDR